MYEQFAVMSKEFLDLQRAIADIKRQLTNITYAVSELCADDGGGVAATAGVPSFRPQQEGLDSETISPPGYLAALSQSNEVYYCIKGGTQTTTTTTPDISLSPADENTFGRVNDVAKPRHHITHVLPQRSSDSPRVPVANFLPTQRQTCSPAYPIIADPEFTYTF